MKNRDTPQQTNLQTPQTKQNENEISQLSQPSDSVHKESIDVPVPKEEIQEEGSNEREEPREIKSSLLQNSNFDNELSKEPSFKTQEEQDQEAQSNQQDRDQANQDNSENTEKPKKKSKLFSMLSSDTKEKVTVKVKSSATNQPQPSSTKKDNRMDRQMFLDKRAEQLYKNQLTEKEKEEKERREFEERKKKEREHRLELERLIREQEELELKEQQEQQEEKRRQEEKERLRLEEEDRLRREAEEKAAQEKASNLKVENIYFLVDPTERQTANVYDIDYLMSFSYWRICQDVSLFDDNLKKHFENLKKFEIDSKGIARQYQGSNTSKFVKGKVKYERESNPMMSSFSNSNTFTRGASKIELSEPDKNLEKWGRKDLSKIEKEAEEQRQMILKAREEDPIKDEIMEHLNKMTVDTYDHVRDGIYEIIKDSLDNQKKLIEVLFKRAISEKTYVYLYAKLCKDYDRELPQRTTNEAKDGKTQVTTIFRSELIAKSKTIFNRDAEEGLEMYNKIEDPEEKAMKMKQYLLGNVNFITELISSKLLSKNVVFQCVKSLFSR